MCLYTKQQKPIKATKDITVYKTANCYATGKKSKDGYSIIGNKVVKEGGYDILSLTATSRSGFAYQVGKVMKAALQTEMRGGQVNPGFHSYHSKTTCKKNESGSLLLTCIIPKGSLYYKGSNNGNGAGYCSNQLKIVEINAKS